MRAPRFTIGTTCLVVVLSGCSPWSSTDRSTNYTVSNHCNEDLIVTPLGGTAITLPASATILVRTNDQDPSTTFVISRPDGTKAVRVQPGMSTVAIENDDCPSNR